MRDLLPINFLGDARHGWVFGIHFGMKPEPGVVIDFGEVFQHRWRQLTQHVHEWASALVRQFVRTADNMSLSPGIRANENEIEYCFHHAFRLPVA